MKGCFHIGSVSGKIEPDKVRNAGFTVEKSERINAPRIRECKINIECTLENIITTGDHDLFVGKVISVSIDSKIEYSIVSDDSFIKSPKKLTRSIIGKFSKIIIDDKNHMTYIVGDHSQIGAENKF